MRKPTVDWRWTAWAFGYASQRRYSYALGYELRCRSLYLGPLHIVWVGRAD